MKRLIAAVGAIVFALASAGASAAEAPVTLRLSHWVPPSHPLQPGYAGIRPKINGPSEPAADFVVQGPDIHGVPGLINLYGIESPGLTASLAIADHVLKVAATG